MDLVFDNLDVMSSNGVRQNGLHSSSHTFEVVTSMSRTVDKHLDASPHEFAKVTMVDLTLFF